MSEAMTKEQLRAAKAAAKAAEAERVRALAQSKPENTTPIQSYLASPLEEGVHEVTIGSARWKARSSDDQQVVLLIEAAKEGKSALLAYATGSSGGLNSFRYLITQLGMSGVTPDSVVDGALRGLTVKVEVTGDRGYAQVADHE